MKFIDALRVKGGFVKVRVEKGTFVHIDKNGVTLDKTTRVLTGEYLCSMYNNSTGHKIIAFIYDGSVHGLVG